MSVVIETTIGTVTANLFITERPQTCLNFLKLCKVKYYDHNLFHNVTGNFLAQTGDPTGKGDGGECIYGVIKGSEYRFYQGEKQPKIKHDRIGLLSMVSHGNGMFGSQFFITLSSDLTSLDNEHCVFGQLDGGDELLLKLNETITDPQHRPYQDIRIVQTAVVEDPYPDPNGLIIPKESSAKDAAYSRIPANEALTEDFSKEEVDEMVQAKEAAARATILEMVGDLPDADIKPPENVLFVCKLNPVTTDNDLAIIFSRFGKVKSCEVIRDSVSGDSLQYAFIEFEEKKACEEAYFKMENVLIDDRRIHVDFSQSVAKWRGKGKGFELLQKGPMSKNRSNYNERNRPRGRNEQRYNENKYYNHNQHNYNHRNNRHERVERDRKDPSRSRSNHVDEKREGKRVSKREERPRDIRRERSKDGGSIEHKKERKVENNEGKRRRNASEERRTYKRKGNISEKKDLKRKRKKRPPSSSSSSSTSSSSTSSSSTSSESSSSSSSSSESSSDTSDSEESEPRKKRKKTSSSDKNKVKKTRRKRAGVKTKNKFKMTKRKRKKRVSD